ncbi:MAG: class I SAM-dependent methyltransferase [Magnetococcales bacterium]|nr:class I SAM-dependent methyltransferase [Magnetococcales bacterium]
MAYYQCGSCGFVYSGTFLSPEASIRFYDAKHQYLNYASYVKPSVALGKSLNFRDSVALLRASFPGAGRRALDIGCGSGQSLEVLQGCGYEPTGLEISRYAAGMARERGVGEVHCADARQLATLGLPRFDAIFMFDVLDHVNQPGEVMQTVFDQLQPGGGVILEVVNIASPLAYLMGSRYMHIIPYEHLSYFSPQTLRHFLARCGFAEIVVKPAYRFVTFDFIVTTLLEFNPMLGRMLQVVGKGVGRTLREKPFPIPCGALCGIAGKA